MPAPDIKALADKLTRELLDQGKIIEAGWAGFQMLVVPQDASTVQRNEMRLAFFSGAQHLFASIMSGLEEGKDETPADLRRMDNIHRELKQFADQFRRSRLNG